MPECHRCHRVQPTAELRRTPLGFLCKWNARFSPCWQIVQQLRAAAREQRRLERRQAAA